MARTPKVVEDRREQIMDAALRVFARKGFVRASNKDIAREAGITPGLIYHYFKSKNDLLRAVFEARSPLQSVRASAEQMLELSSEKVLRSFAEQILTVAEDEKFIQLLRVYLSELMYNPAIASVGMPFIQEGTGLLENYLSEKMGRGELRRADARLAAYTFMGSIMDLVLLRHVLRDPVVLEYSHAQIVESVVSTTLRGLEPR